jgi:multidrug transporter EmrE-like cation transporter
MLLISPWFVAAISVYGLSTLLWVYILVRLPLSTAYPFALVGTALVPIAAHFAFDESLGKRAWVGFCVILCGLYIMNSK